MSASLNKVQLIGNVGKDSDLKFTPSGIAVATFSIATSESWKDADGNKQEKTEWHNIVAWRKLAEICGEYVKKGTKVYIEGKLQTRNYEKDGVKRYVTEIVADKVIFLGGKQKDAVQEFTPEEVAQNSASQTESGPKDDDLPF